MQSLVVPLGKFPHFDILKLTVTKLMRKHSGTQLMVQTTDPSIEDWDNGVGRIANLDHPESAYCHLQPSLKGTMIEKLIEFIPMPVYRGRIMIMEPRKCYSVHTDPTPRVHVPLVTSDQAWFVFPRDNQSHHLPADGTVYFTDTRATHSFLNGAETERVHLVFCTTPQT